MTARGSDASSTGTDEIMFLVVNQASGAVLTATVGERLNPALVTTLNRGDALELQLWAFLGNGRLMTSPSVRKMLVRASTAHRPGKKADAAFVADLGAHADVGKARPDEGWEFDAQGVIRSSGPDRAVLDVKGFSTTETAQATVYPLRQMNTASQRWFLIPRIRRLHSLKRKTPELEPARPPRPISAYMLVNTASGLALDAQSDGRVSLFGCDSSSPTQCWQFRSYGGGLTIRHMHTGLVLTQGDAADKVVLMPHASPERDTQLWQFDPKGVIVSRQNGSVLDAPTLADGVQVVVAPRKTNVAGLGMLFSKWSSDSQIFRAVPIMFEPPTSPGPPSPPGPADQVTDTPVLAADQDGANGHAEVVDALDLGLAALETIDRDMNRSISPAASQLDRALDALDQLSDRIANPHPGIDSPGMPSPAVPDLLRVGPLCTEARAAANPALQQITDHVHSIMPKDPRGYISGLDLKGVLEHSLLQQPTLLAIWGQVDAHNLGKVGRHQLCILLGLVSQAQGGDAPDAMTVDLGTIAPPRIKGVEVTFSEVWM